MFQTSRNVFTMHFQEHKTTALESKNEKKTSWENVTGLGHGLIQIKDNVNHRSCNRSYVEASKQERPTKN